MGRERSISGTTHRMGRIFEELVLLPVNNDVVPFDPSGERALNPPLRPEPSPLPPEQVVP